MIFNEKDWYMLASLFDGVPDEFQLNPDGTRKFDASGRVLRVPYAGYKPHVAEAPNGDMKVCPDCNGRAAADTDLACKCHGTGRVPNVAPPTTRYLHVAPKYSPPPWAMAYLARAHYEACRVAEALGVPAAYYPRVADGTLRVLDYDAAQCEPRDGLAEASPCTRCGRTVWAKGAPELCPGIGAWAQPEHTDFDLFTVNCYRSDSNALEAYEHHVDTVANTGVEWDEWTPGTAPYHIGEIGELVGLGPATPHRVPARPYRQRSIVYFAMPDHAARLPSRHRWCDRVEEYHEVPGRTVGEWLKERLARSRVYK